MREGIRKGAAGGAWTHENTGTRLGHAPIVLSCSEYIGDGCKGHWPFKSSRLDLDM